MTRSQAIPVQNAASLTRQLLGGAAVLVVLGAGTAALWWRPASRIDDVISAIGTVLPTIVLVAAALIVGAAAYSLVPGQASRPYALGPIAGLGIAVSVVTGGICHWLGNVLVAGPVLLVASVIVLLLRFFYDRRRDHLTVRAWTRRVVEGGRDGARSELAIAGVIAISGFAVARFGLTSWTMFVNDFQRYASSASVWISDAGTLPDFAAQHPDSYGEAAIGRAGFEKPLATALLVLGHQLTGLAPFRLLTPFVVVLLWVCASSLAHVVRTRFGLLGLLPAVVVLPSTLSIIPLSRLADAQLGQVTAHAMLATALAWRASTVSRGRIGEIGVGVVSGLAFAAALGANATVVLSLVPVLVIVTLWVSPKISPWFWTAVVVSAAIASSPFVADYLRSIGYQTSGESGYAVPFPSVLAAVGLQGNLTGLGAVNAVTWLVVLVPASILLVLSLRRRPDSRWALATTIGTLGVLGFLVIIYGPDNYATHKWLAGIIALVLPILIGYAVACIPTPTARARHVVTATFAILSATAVVIGSSYLYGITHVVPRDLIALSESSALAAEDLVNIDLGDEYNDAMAPLIIPSRAIISAATTYSPASPPVGNSFLIPSPAVAPGDVVVARLNDSYSLVHRPLDRDAGLITFGSDTVDAATLLYGRWYAPEATGTWSRSGSALIVLDPSGSVADGDVQVSMTISQLADPEHPRTAEMTVNGRTIDAVPAVSREPTTVTFVVTRSELERWNGRLVIELRNATDVPARAFGIDDDRSLAVKLISLEMSTPPTVR